MRSGIETPHRFKKTVWVKEGDACGKANRRTGNKENA